MRTLTRWVVVLGTLSLASAALAQGGQGDKRGAWAALLLLPMVAVPLQLLLTSLFPGAAKRLSLSLRNRAESTIAWGALVLVLAILVAAVPSRLGGPPGRALGGLIATMVLLTAMAGGAGFSLLAGSWSLRRDGKDGAPTFVAVLIGGILLGAATWIPVVGQLLSLALLVLSLGAVVRATVGVPSLETPVTPQPATAVPPPPPPPNGVQA